MPKEIIDTSEMIFVFGSNEAGIHGGGAARYAKMERGAEWGFSYGRTGECFAIPTKGFKHYPETNNRPTGIGVGDTLSLPRIMRYVQGFLAYAEGHPKEHYQVTCIGCGLAGLQHKDIAPMFDFGLDNLWFDLKWKPYLNHTRNYWGEG